METRAFSELFPLFNTASLETLEWLMSIAVEQEYAQDTVILNEDNWGRAVYFIVSGWVKIQKQYGEKWVTQDILGQGDFFGEIAILDEVNGNTKLVALSELKVISISAQRFIQTLFKEPQVQHKMLQILVQRLGYMQKRLQRRHYPTGIRLIKTLVFLAEKYGQPTEEGMEIYQIPEQDLADLADISPEETKNILEKLQNKGLVSIEPSHQNICLTNPKQLIHLSRTNIE